MKPSDFIVIAEKIHCTRVFKREGKLVTRLEDGRHAIVYSADSQTRHLPVPAAYEASAEWQKGNIKHCAVAVWQGLHGDVAGQAAGVDYIRALSLAQEKAGGGFLDLNVDEFSTDVEERRRALLWAAEVAQGASRLPLSIDSSNTAILRAGLEVCDRSHGRPLINSVSLERADAIGLAAEFGACAVASAAGEKGLPTSTEERLANLDRLIPALKKSGVPDDALYIDPLVLPIATDSANGLSFLESVRAIRQRYGAAVHITGGFSNVSFGMPGRKVINQTFTYLAVEAGADSGIVDPGQINGRILAGTDSSAEPFRMARALLLGEDEFGMEFISACREGRI
jgi:5-methyltetrahydrofolate--homocysteine methyltransferase